jgi:hypothetical protein
MGGKGLEVDAAVALQSINEGISQQKPPANPAVERLLVFLPYPQNKFG